MTESFGRRLQRERERRQITVESIAAGTKIKGSLFEELERDDASHWPSGIFRRSFMRAYAEAVGLDAEATVREFLQRFPDPSDVPSDTTASAASRPDAGGPQSAPAEMDGAARREPSSSALRLTLVETGLPFSGGRLLADVRRRWSAAAWDFGSILAIAVLVFVVIDSFWRPFAVVSLCYYVGGILLLGNSPGVCLFAPRPADGSDNSARPSRITRHRPAAEPGQMRTGEAPLRPARFRPSNRRVGLPN
jgi:transcriptional regulator with XRE-family HTH domain